jgi:hypothetical protein
MSRPRLRPLPRRAIRCLEGAPIMHWPCNPLRLERCSATSLTQSASISGRRRSSPRTVTNSSSAPTAPTAPRTTIRSHTRSASTHCGNIDRVSGWTSSGARHRLGQPAKRPGWPALVLSLPRTAAQTRRSIALDRARPDLELSVRRHSIPITRNCALVAELEKMVPPQEALHLTRNSLNCHRDDGLSSYSGKLAILDAAFG